MDCLIAMDDVSGLANRSNAFAISLPLLENLNTAVYVSFISFIKKVNVEINCHKSKFLISSPAFLNSL